MSEQEVAVNLEESTPEVWWFYLIEFAIHVFVGSGLFVIIYLPAYGLKLCVDWLVLQDAGWAVIGPAMVAEFALVAADTVLFLFFIWRSTRSAWLKIRRST